MAKTNSTHHLRKMRKNTIVAQDLEHELFKVWSGRVVSKQFIESKLNKGNKFYDVKFHEATFVNPKDGVAYFKTVADTPNVDLRTVKSTKMATKHHGGGVVINNINKRSSWWWLWIVVTILSIVIIILALLLGLKSCRSENTTGIALTGNSVVVGDKNRAIRKLEIKTNKVNSSGHRTLLTSGVTYDFDDSSLPNGLVTNEYPHYTYNDILVNTQAEQPLSYTFEITGTPQVDDIELSIPLTAHWNNYSITENIHFIIHEDDSSLIVNGNLDAVIGSIGEALPTRPPLSCETNSGSSVSNPTYYLYASDGIASPTLPNGVTFNSNTGHFEGTPTEAWPETVYKIKATAELDGETIESELISVVLKIDEGDPITHLVITDAPTEITGEINSPITSTPSLTTTTNTGEPVSDAYYDTKEPLPEGLEIDHDTGVISGTLEEPFEGTITITVHSDDYDLDGEVEVEVSIVAPDPTSLTINTIGNISCVVNEIMTSTQSLTCKTNTGVLVSDPVYTISQGSLPTGMSFNPSTGVFSGTPTSTMAATQFKVSVTSPTYSSLSGESNEFSITVTAGATGGPNMIWLYSSSDVDVMNQKGYSMNDIGCIAKLCGSTQTLNLYDPSNGAFKDIQVAPSDIARINLTENGMGWDGGQILTAFPNNFLSGANLGSEYLTGTNLFPSTLLTIGYNVLSGTDINNFNITIPKAVQSIGDGFYSNSLVATNTVRITFEDDSSLTTIGNGFLYGNAVFNREVLLPRTVNSLGSNFISNCLNFDSPVDLSGLNLLNVLEQRFLANDSWFNSPVNLPPNISIIKGDELNCGFMMYDANFNQPITLPSTLQTIGNEFLIMNEGFDQNIDLPSNVTHVGSDFLFDCPVMSKDINFGVVTASSIVASDGSLSNELGYCNGWNLSNTPFYNPGYKVLGSDVENIKTLLPTIMLSEGHITLDDVGWANWWFNYQFVPDRIRWYQ